MYYHGFDNRHVAGNKYWTVYDDQLITLLFSKIINKTATTGDQSDDLMDEVVNNLFDLCFYINKDVKEC